MIIKMACFSGSEIIMNIGQVSGYICQSIFYVAMAQSIFYVAIVQSIFYVAIVLSIFYVAIVNIFAVLFFISHSMNKLSYFVNIPDLFFCVSFCLNQVYTMSCIVSCYFMYIYYNCALI
ncbi:hypothetical protein ACF0H5_000137 [Mactra antiquata]